MTTAKPPRLLPLAEAEHHTGMRRRTLNNRVLDHGIGIWREGRWLIDLDGLDALANNDTGGLADVQVRIKIMADTD